MNDVPIWTAGKLHGATGWVSVHTYAVLAAAITYYWVMTALNLQGASAACREEPPQPPEIDRGFALGGYAHVP